MDHIAPERRSWLMSRVGSKDTSAEMRVRRTAHALGLRYRLHRRDLPGTPDLVFPKDRLVIFVHGCFWHRHPNCKKASMPKSRTEYWQAKFNRNVERDRQTLERLKELGWRTAVIWECETRTEGEIVRSLDRIREVSSGESR